MKKKSYKSLLFIIIIFSGMFFLSKQFPVFEYFFNNIVFLDKHSPSFSSANAFMDLEFMAKHSDLVIVGEVISNGVVEHKTIDRSESEIEKDNRLGIKPLGYDVTHTKIKIKEVISGRCKDDEIIISQLGTSDNYAGETKVKKGKTMILLLNKHPNEDILYSSVNLNDGLYEVNDSGKIGVLSDKEDFKKYEDMGKKDFIKEVRKLRRYNISLMTLYLILMFLAISLIKKSNLRKNRKLYRMLPYGNLLIASLILMAEIMKLGIESNSISSNINFFFNTEGMFLFYSVYVPCIIIGTVGPLLSNNEDTENTISEEQ